ncbi:MAG: ATP-binding protein, partial [Myxococcota bacterium]
PTLGTPLPRGPILHDLVSNATQHALPAGFDRRPEIYIGLQRRGSGVLSLVVADNGIGLPAGIDAYHPRSLGLTLVATLTEQLKGAMEVRSDPGTEFAITFTERKRPGSER